MLQQTRVEVVSERFPSFLEAFPDIASLAKAPEEAVLAAWSGLGYYSRARNLHGGAKVLVKGSVGVFPRSLPAARSLPGVGPYTAAAVLSIAYGLPHAVVDGNVVRVLARLFCLAGLGGGGSGVLSGLAGELLDPARPGDHNQAMMELGAVLCLPRAPRCGECPVSGLCGALSRGIVDSVPAPRPRPTTIDLEPALFLLRDGRGRLLLEKGRWRLLPHLWLPPIGEPAGKRDPSFHDLPADLRALLPRRPPALRELGSFRHTITRYRLRFQVLGGSWPAAAGSLPEGFLLADGARLQEIGRSAVLTKALRLEAGPARKRAE